MEQFFSKNNSKFEERFTQLGDISHHPNCIYYRENFTTTNSNQKNKILISDYFPMEYKNNFDKLTTLVKENRNNIDKFELLDFITEIEDKLNKLKEATGLYNINPNEQSVQFHNDKFNTN